ncbi:hypothetical protein [Micromonospora humi]|uniref:Uncharacterized protein n=1 Tax=Micromonospora humi TaxID=745366 RepID=A0A1C5ILD1_9ACTN|nr:hypothetical protein [Micromonospora humi]SCG59112.1 hypothetical protein GA0070213_106154 [Micromonospora humi]
MAGVMASTALLLAGLFADLGPPPPAGELVPGTVLALEQDSAGRPAVALLRVDATDGPVFCGIDRTAFPGEHLPRLNTQMTVDYTPTHCAPAPVSRELPRWLLLTTGGGGLALMVLYLRRAGPITVGRFMAAWTRGGIGRGR